MKNIHILPTNDISRLHEFGGQFILENKPTLNFRSQHIYITSEEEIKEGDWFIRKDSIYKCFKVHKTDIEFLTSINSVYCGSNTFWSKEYCKKIILTTDESLIVQGVQAVDKEFLEWFINNQDVDYVKITTSFAENTWSENYKIIIPKHKSLIEKMKPLQKQWQKDMIKINV